MKSTHRTTTFLTLLLAAASGFADGGSATSAEAGERLRGIVALVKARGPASAGAQIMSADDPLKCHYKDISCLLITTADATFVANTAVPQLVGQNFPADMADVDGVPIIGQQVGPAKAGKTRWAAKFKFAQPGSKKVVPRRSFCEKADDAHVACVVINES